MADVSEAGGYSDYDYYADYDYDDGSLSTDEPGESGGSSRRARQVLLVRPSRSEGFGFTLRHFIAYPEYDEYDEDQRVHTTVEKQETIFVSGVVPGGPAHLAGVQLGDRVLSVNGLPVWDLSYADVVYQVQLSGKRLQLRLVSRDEDVLQQAWGDTAHHPASNLNMKQFSHLPRPPPYRPGGGGGGSGPLALGSLGQAAVAVAAPRLAAEDSTSLTDDRSTCSRRPSTMSTLSLQLPPSVSGSSELADANDPAYSRIRKAVETKQEFLSRPVQPVWQAVPPQTPVVREYHVNPARFPRTPWPPEAVAAGGAPRQRSAGGEPERRRRRPRAEPATAPAGRAAPPAFPSARASVGGSLSLSSSTDSLVSLPSGVSNSTARPYAPPPAAESAPPASPEYVQYDAVTQVPRAKPPPPPPTHKTHIVSRRARQFETGCIDNDTYAVRGGCRSELDLLAEHGRRPSVRLRRSEFERDPDASDNGRRLQSVMSDPELDLSCLERQCQEQLQQQHQQLYRHHRYRRSHSCDAGHFVSQLAVLLKASGAEDRPRRPPRTGGNRMVIVGGPKLHAEPLNEAGYREVPQKKSVLRRRSDADPSDPSAAAGAGGWPFSPDEPPPPARPLSNIAETDLETAPDTNGVDTAGGKTEEMGQSKESRTPAVTMRSRPQHRALRQPSYMAAVKTPTPEARPGPPAASAVTAAAEPAMLDSVSSPPAPGDGPRPQRPTFLAVTPSAAAGAAAGTDDTVISGDPDTKSPPLRAASSPPLEPGKTSTPLSLMGVVRRQKPFDGTLMLPSPAIPSMPCGGMLSSDVPADVVQTSTELQRERTRSLDQR